MCRITRGKAQGCDRPLVERINGQPIAFKAAAAFVAGPLILASALTPGSTLLRMAASTCGVLVTIIDGGHVIRWWRKRSAEKTATGTHGEAVVSGASVACHRNAVPGRDSTHRAPLTQLARLA